MVPPDKLEACERCACVPVLPVLLSFICVPSLLRLTQSPKLPLSITPFLFPIFSSRTRAYNSLTAHLLLMVEYVYGRYDFVAEDDDEISFSAGERIEVVKKDEIDQNGWWEVRSRSLLSISPIFLSSQLPHFLLEAAPCPSLTSSLYLRFLLPTF